MYKDQTDQIMTTSSTNIQSVFFEEGVCSGKTTRTVPTNNK